jgi:hypothetical protein
MPGTQTTALQSSIEGNEDRNLLSMAPNRFRGRNSQETTEEDVFFAHRYKENHQDAKEIEALRFEGTVVTGGHQLVSIDLAKAKALAYPRRTRIRGCS